MENNLTSSAGIRFHRLKIIKKELITKNVFRLVLAVPQDRRENFSYCAGQYLRFKIKEGADFFLKDYSMISAPFEENLEFGIKINSENSAPNFLFENYNIGDGIEVSEPRGRFTLVQKPHEFRTILGFAAGIGITPILSHFKEILHAEPRTRLFLFYGNKTSADIAFREEIDRLAKYSNGRFQVFYFLSKEKNDDALFNGRIDAHRLKLIINQILHLDDTDEESTIWDAVDEVLICGKGEMIRELANASFENGIPKKNIHFELFEEFNEDIYPQEKDFALIENINVDFKINGKNYSAELPDNKSRILQQLLIQKFPVPYSCKSGICGSCECLLQEGEVELLENEYLTEREEKGGKILACMAVPMSRKIKLNFDLM